jgi:hypothetical protein
MSYDIRFYDGAYDYQIDEEGFLVITLDEDDENGEPIIYHTIGPSEMDAFIEWLAAESRRKAALRKAVEASG